MYWYNNFGKNIRPFNNAKTEESNFKKFYDEIFNAINKGNSTKKINKKASYVEISTQTNSINNKLSSVRAEKGSNYENNNDSYPFSS